MEALIKEINQTLMPPTLSVGAAMFKIPQQIRVVSLTLTALLCLFSAGCGVPLRVPTKTRGVSGEFGKKFDLDFIQVGVTTREEVEQKLGWIDTGVKTDRYFLGRWASSGWAEGDPWNRRWSVHNLLVDFDKRGIVQKISHVRDKDLFETLSALAAQDSSGALNLSPICVPVKVVDDGFRQRFLGTLTLGKDAFQFLQDRKAGSAKKYMAFKTSPENISHLSLAQVTVEDPRILIETIHFKEKTPAGKKMNVQIDLPRTVTLIRYIAQTRPGP
jgi:hypothetical protein